MSKASPTGPSAASREAVALTPRRKPELAVPAATEPALATASLPDVLAVVVELGAGEDGRLRPPQPAPAASEPSRP